MKCTICKNGEVKPGFATVTLSRGNATVVVKNVPAHVCDNCGEYFLDDEVAGKILERAEAAIKRGIEVEILSYAA